MAPEIGCLVPNLSYNGKTGTGDGLGCGSNTRLEEIALHSFPLQGTFSGKMRSKRCLPVVIL